MIITTPGTTHGNVGLVDHDPTTVPSSQQDARATSDRERAPQASWCQVNRAPPHPAGGRRLYHALPVSTGSAHTSPPQPRHRPTSPKGYTPGRDLPKQSPYRMPQGRQW